MSSARTASTSSRRRRSDYGPALFLTAAEFDRALRVRNGTAARLVAAGLLTVVQWTAPGTWRIPARELDRISVEGFPRAQARPARRRAVVAGGGCNPDRIRELRVADL